MVWVNSENVRHLPTPFGGTKASGIGRDGGDYSFDFYMETKNIAIALDNHKIPKIGRASHRPVPPSPLWRWRSERSEDRPGEGDLETAKDPHPVLAPLDHPLPQGRGLHRVLGRVLMPLRDPFQSAFNIIRATTSLALQVGASLSLVGNDVPTRT